MLGVLSSRLLLRMGGGTCPASLLFQHTAVYSLFIVGLMLFGVIVIATYEQRPRNAKQK